MRPSPSHRTVLAASAVGIALALPLSLTGCGGADSSSAPPPSPKNFQETHKDAFAEFNKNKAQSKKGSH